MFFIKTMHGQPRIYSRCPNKYKFSAIQLDFSKKDAPPAKVNFAAEAITVGIPNIDLYKAPQIGKRTECINERKE